MPKYAEEILAAVTGLQRHPTAEQVFMEMKKEHPSIAIGTVYKHLNALAEEGLLHRITESGSPDRYDRTERHDHLICSRCGKIADVHLPDMQSQIERALGREILSYDLKIRYICPDRDYFGWTKKRYPEMEVPNERPFMCLSFAGSLSSISRV